VKNKTNGKKGKPRITPRKGEIAGKWGKMTMHWKEKGERKTQQKKGKRGTLTEWGR